MKHDPVNRPKHYTSHPSGVECIRVTEHFPFNIGSAIKYLWRADLKGRPITDLRKARWYIDREIKRREAEGLPDDLRAAVEDMCREIEATEGDGDEA